jgi:hypothetical protein
MMQISIYVEADAYGHTINQIFPFYS